MKGLKAKRVCEDAGPIRTRHRGVELGSAFRRLLHRPCTDWMLLLEALGTLALARFALCVLPFRWVAWMCGEKGVESLEVLPEDQAKRAERVGWAVAAMARYVPWDGRCLTQALAAMRMLARRGLPGTVYIGVKGAPETSNGLLFHAWLRCGSVFVTGGDGRSDFQLLAFFSRKEPPLA